MSFCFCTDQKDGAKNVYEVDQELGGVEWSTFCVPGGGESEASANLRGCARGGGGGMATSQSEPYKFSSFYLPEKLKGLINSRSRVLVFFKSL